MLFRLFLLLFLPLTAWAENELGHPVFRNFAVREYRQHNQNWAAAQGPDGRMFFGNRSCVLTYDGTEWRSLPVPDTAFVRGIAFSPDGRLYAGAVNQLGYFQENTAGGREFVSLLEKLPPEVRDFRDIRSVTAENGENGENGKTEKTGKRGKRGKRGHASYFDNISLT